MSSLVLRSGGFVLRTMPHIRPIVGGFMQIGVLKETWPGEVRAAIVPANASKLIKQGFTVAVQSGLAMRPAMPMLTTRKQEPVSSKIVVNC